MEAIYVNEQSQRAGKPPCKKLHAHVQVSTNLKPQGDCVAVEQLAAAEPAVSVD